LRGGIVKALSNNIGPKDLNPQRERADVYGLQKGEHDLSGGRRGKMRLKDGTARRGRGKI